MRIVASYCQRVELNPVPVASLIATSFVPARLPVQLQRRCHEPKPISTVLAPLVIGVYAAVGAALEDGSVAERVTGVLVSTGSSDVSLPDYHT